MPRRMHNMWYRRLCPALLHHVLRAEASCKPTLPAYADGGVTIEDLASGVYRMGFTRHEESSYRLCIIAEFPSMFVFGQGFNLYVLTWEPSLMLLLCYHLKILAMV